MLNNLILRIAFVSSSKFIIPFPYILWSHLTSVSSFHEGTEGSSLLGCHHCLCSAITCGEPEDIPAGILERKCQTFGCRISYR